MHRIVMQKFSLTDRMDQAESLQRVELSVDETEWARLGAVRDLLGGKEDAMANSEQCHGTLFFRRLTPDAPGGIGYMVAAELFDGSGVRLMPQRLVEELRIPS